MRKKEKIMIIIFVVITIFFIIWCVSHTKKDKGENQKGDNTKEEFVEILQDGTRLNISSKLQETKIFEGMEISNLQLTENNNVTLLLGTVTNSTTTTKGGYPINIKIIDKNGDEIITVVAYIGELAPGEKTQLSTSATFDYVNAYDFVIRKR